MKKRTTTLLVIAVMLGFGGVAYGVGQASANWNHHSQSQGPAIAPAKTAPSASTTAAATPTRAPTPTVAPKPTPSVAPKPKLVPGKQLWGPGDNSPAVRKLQARLKQIGWFAGLVTDNYGSVTTSSVKGFQAKRKIPVTGYVDQRTMDRLNAMTHEPSANELANIVPSSNGNRPGALDPRCTTGRTMCIDKSSRTIRWVIDGKVLKTMDVRFGSTLNNTPTREGLFHVGWKSRDHVSKEYDSAMPFAMFFSGGQAVHYSSDFAARGYAGASHGCVNVRDRAGVEWLFDQVNVGDKVVVYWS